ncbi:hypothetical protein FKM82_017448 [Ascaphus truei]
MAPVICNPLCANGQCYIEPGTSTPMCRCNSGFRPAQSGMICIDINECELNTNRCQQLCSNTIGGFSCSCQDGFEIQPTDGKTCNRVDHCKGLPCKHGQCRNGLYSFECICDPGWEGAKCDKDVNECTRNNPCSRQGTCVNTEGSYTCLCKAGWTGTTCFEDVNECLPYPCVRGTCKNTIGSYTCVCPAGYTGVNCQTDIDECLSSPCRNAATCNNLVNAFSCSCRPGYTGRFCEIDINECASSPCKRGGICIDQVNNFFCSCPVNWQGRTCETDVDECQTGRSRCHSLATCTNTPGSYYCTCNPGYIGDGFTCREDRLFEYKSGIRITQRYRDFTSPLISVPTGFPFGSKFYSNLYFTDNGVIMFQRNIYEPRYTYSYPYSRFYSNDQYTPPMVAVFWADADLSTGIGEVYYQTYDFQSPSALNTGFKNQLENEIKSYFNPSPTFKALWAMKVTWERVAPYPAQYFSWADTNTYQAVLVTNGIYSFCLTRFEDGGMNWRYNVLPMYYLPKMGYFSGEPTPFNSPNNFPAFNDPQTEPSVSLQQRYTPDQYVGYNTNKKGFGAYRLESNTANTETPRQQCLNWYYSEPYPYWSFNTRPCPCSWWQANLIPHSLFQ